MKKLLTIAGSDSSGGAGIQADLKTFAAHNMYGMSVITAITAQNTLGVTGIHDVPADIVGQQLDAVFTDIYPDAIKIGMLSNEAVIKKIAEKLKEYQASKIVLDPVMVATSGSSLIKDSAVQTIIKELFPLVDIITPNMDEAGVLAGIEVKTKEDMEKAAKIIGKNLKGAVLITGGHLENCADDLLFVAGEIHWLEAKRVDNPNTHGTGCTLSSAIAANLAVNNKMIESVKDGKDYLLGAIANNFDLGQGRGPLNHLYLNNF